MIEAIRLAAELMRNRAKAATPGPWLSLPHGWIDSTADDNGVIRTCSAREEDAVHIASWHPVVALAIADWLDEVNPIDDDFGDALNVASAYLREEL